MSELSSVRPTTQDDILSRPVLATVSLDWEKAIYLAIIVVAIVSRFWDLGSRVVSHDESLHTQYSYQYFNGDGYVHTPLMHGPTLFHLTALSYWLFGDNDFSSRIPVAIIGIILVVLPYFLRDWIGRIGALVASFLLLISPYITYYSRYIRHDILAITCAAVVFIAIQHYLRRQEDKYLWWFAGALGLLFATMETSYIYVALFGSFLALRLGLKVLAAPWLREKLPAMPLAIILLGAAVFLISVGFFGQRLVPRMLEDSTPAATVTTEGGFAADPNEDQSVPTSEISPSGTIAAMRWMQVVGILLLAAGLFYVAYVLRPYLEKYPEFDLVTLLTTLVLPGATAFLVIIAGYDPMKQTTNTSITTLAAFLSCLRDGACRSALFSTDVWLTILFLIATLVTAVLVGLWWHSRRWLTAAAIFYTIFIVLFTSFFTNLAGLSTGFVGSLAYWLVQHDVRRADQPGYFYFIVLPLYEFLPIIFTLAGAYLWTRKYRLHKIAVYWLGLGLLALLVYSLANWFFNRSLLPEEAPNRLYGVLLAGLVVMAGLLYWFLSLAAAIRRENELKRSWRGLIPIDDLFGFVPYLVWWFVLSWVIYSLAGEKMAWLSTHFILPMVLLSGWYFNEKLANANPRELFSRHFALLVGLVVVFIVAVALALGPVILGQIRLGGQEASNLSGLGRFLGGLVAAGLLAYAILQLSRQTEAANRGRAWLLGVFALLSLLTIRFTYMANFPNADYTTEFLVYAHGAPATKSQVMDKLEELSMRLHGDKSIKVAFDNDSSWPFTWYLRDYPNRMYFGDNPGRNVTDAPVILVGSLNWNKVEPLLGDDYEAFTYTFLWWPMEKYRELSWNAIFGDPNMLPEERRGLGNPGVRQALWNIFFYRDYQKFGEVFGGSYLPGQWPLRHDLRMYIRKDVLVTLWDHGVTAAAAEPPVDPYAANAFQLAPILVVGSPGSGDGQLLQPRNLAIGPDGMIYVADSGNHRIQVFDQQGRFVRGWGAFGQAEGLLNEPWDIAVSDEYVYVADTWNHRLQQFTLDGGFVRVIGVSGSPLEGQEGGGLFFGPRDIGILPDGNLLVTDTGNHRLQVLDAAGNFIRQIGSRGTELGRFQEPVGIGLNPDGLVYVADTWNGRIVQLSQELLPVNQWLVDAWEGESINNKPYLAVDGRGRVYVTDPEGFRILIFDAFGQYLGRFGEYGTDFAGFGLPTGIEIDAEGNVYIADAGNSYVLKFAPVFKDVQVDEGLDEEIPGLENGPQDESLDTPTEEAMEEEPSPTAEEAEPTLEPSPTPTEEDIP
ncbi:MAG: TIGR03663 family protein [Chloroflexi bacterium]|nr:TIGR03663 family protein [Chloroflexota bacterium]MCI0578707.1 TIGR03663 family protein [Chloroflexota bacterium]MCI0648367.1 TIGR03663 family protein [Chloroflexota bacterium]MCI0730946.1 TIGR03663 family protein [Chloroflexota bacterium]